MKKLIYVFLFLGWISCGPSRYIVPLEKGEQAVSASLGGAMIEFAGAPIPIPNTSLGYAYGVEENVTAFGNLYTTSMLYGVFQIDGGATWRFFGNDSTAWGSSATGFVNATFDKWEGNFKAWPVLEWNAYRFLGNTQSYCSFGVGSWFELSGKKAHDQQQNEHVLLYPQAGFTLVRNKWNLEFQLRWLAPGRPNLPNAVTYLGFGGQGAAGVYFNFVRRF